MRINNLIVPLLSADDLPTIASYISSYRQKRHRDMETSPKAKQLAKRKQKVSSGVTTEQYALLAELGISAKMVRELRKQVVKEL